MVKGNKHRISILSAVSAALLYAISAPVSKLLLKEISPAYMAALLYLGAGAGMLAVGAVQRQMRKKSREDRLGKEDLPYVIGMIVLDIAAPITLMIGLNVSTAATASLLNNFEIVATSVIALVLFKETISRRLWLAIGLITAASILLSLKDMDSISFSPGSLLILLACVFWGFENNCTKRLSHKNPLQVVVIKGFGSGTGSLGIALFLREVSFSPGYVLAALGLGFVAYGLSIFLYVYAQRELGAAKTSAYYAFAPFIGAALSFVIFMEWPTVSFLIALCIMLMGAYFASTDHRVRETKADKDTGISPKKRACP